MASNAQRVVVAVDGSKIGKVILAKMVPLDRIDHLVTDSSGDHAELERITAAGEQVHVVDVSDGRGCTVAVRNAVAVPTRFISRGVANGDLLQTN